MEQWRLKLELRMLEPEAPQYALLEVAAPLQEGQLLAGPWLAPEVKRVGPSLPSVNCKDGLVVSMAL